MHTSDISCLDHVRRLKMMSIIAMLIYVTFQYVNTDLKIKLKKYCL